MADGYGQADLTPLEMTTRDFSGGYIDRVEDHLLPENASRDCQNWIAKQIGSMVKRGGQSRLNSTALAGSVQGMYAYYYGATPVRRLVVAAGTSVSYWNPTVLEFVDIKTGLDATAPTFFETCVNYMVAMNGVDAPWKWDGVSASVLANAPADGQFPVLHKEKLFCVPKSAPSRLRWSGSFAPETWPPENHWDVKTGDGDVTTCLRAHYGELLIFKRRSTHILRGSSMDDFRLLELDSRVGCVGNHAAVTDGPYCYFVSDSGLYVWNGVQVKNLSEERIPILWDNVNKAHLHKAAVGKWKDAVWFALPEGTSTYNNLVLVYSPSNQSFWPWRGINASCFVEYNTGTAVVFYAGDSSAGYVNQQDVGTADFGQPINAYWISKGFHAGSPDRRKKVKKLFVHDSPDTVNTVTVQLSADYEAFADLTLVASGSYLRQFAVSPTINFRYLSLKIVHNAAGACEVRGVVVPYKIKRKPKVG